MYINDLDQPEQWKSEFEDFAKKAAGMMLLTGKNGTGKTYSANAIYNSMRVSKMQDRFFITQSDLNLKWLKYLKEYSDATYLAERYSEAKVLVLDDVGTRAPSESFKDFLYTIIEKRDRIKKTAATIITTNLNADELRNTFGDAIISRIACDSVYVFDGVDRRFKNNKLRRF